MPLLNYEEIKRTADYCYARGWMRRPLASPNHPANIRKSTRKMPSPVGEAVKLFVSLATEKFTVDDVIQGCSRGLGFEPSHGSVSNHLKRLEQQDLVTVKFENLKKYFYPAKAEVAT